MQYKGEIDYWAIVNFLLTLSSKEVSYLSNPDQTVIGCIADGKIFFTPLLSYILEFWIQDSY